MLIFPIEVSRSPLLLILELPHPPPPVEMGNIAPLNKRGGQPVLVPKSVPVKKGGNTMPIFMMFGNYSSDSLKGISSERTKKAVDVIKAHEGKVVSLYAVLGEHDLVFTLDFPDAERALMASVALKKLTGISFRTSPVVEVEKFDTLVSEVKDI